MRHDGHGAVRLFFYDGWDLDRLDAAVASARRHNIYLTITLDDAIGGCGENDKDATWFADRSERDTYRNHMQTLLQRYRGDTTFAWFEFFNEPDDENGALRAFYDEMGTTADTIDPDRLFSSGTVAPYWVDGEDNFLNIHQSPAVDIASLHEYDENETESNHGPRVRANSAGKPVIVGEFGITAREDAIRLPRGALRGQGRGLHGRHRLRRRPRLGLAARRRRVRARQPRRGHRHPGGPADPPARRRARGARHARRGARGAPAETPGEAPAETPGETPGEEPGGDARRGARRSPADARRHPLRHPGRDAREEPERPRAGPRARAGRGAGRDPGEEPGGTPGRTGRGTRETEEPGRRTPGAPAPPTPAPPPCRAALQSAFDLVWLAVEAALRGGVPAAASTEGGPDPVR